MRKILQHALLGISIGMSIAALYSLFILGISDLDLVLLSFVSLILSNQYANEKG